MSPIRFVFASFGRVGWTITTFRERCCSCYLRFWNSRAEWHKTARCSFFPRGTMGTAWRLAVSKTPHTLSTRGARFLCDWAQRRVPTHARCMHVTWIFIRMFLQIKLLHGYKNDCALIACHILMLCYGSHRVSKWPTWRHIPYICIRIPLGTQILINHRDDSDKEIIVQDRYYLICVVVQVLSHVCVQWFDASLYFRTLQKH